MPNNPNKIIIHHDGVSRDGDSLDAINTSHQERGFPLSSRGYYVGYHYLIEKTGAIIQTRDHDEEGAHTVGENERSVGVGLAGNFDEEMPTQEQIESLGIVLNNLSREFNIQADQILPHRRFAEKTCFGSRLPEDWGNAVLGYYQSKILLAKTAEINESWKKRANTPVR